jgi:hypothetical protein
MRSFDHAVGQGNEDDKDEGLADRVTPRTGKIKPAKGSIRSLSGSEVP